MYNNILFPVDLEHTKEAEKALKIAIEEAQRSKAKLTVMTVAPGFGMPIVASFFDEATVKNASLSSGVYTNWPALRGGPPGTQTIQTDSSGRFRLAGMGADRYVRLEAIGGGIGATRLKILTHRTPSDRNR